MTTTYIRGGTVVSPTGCQTLDVLIDGERIAALVDPARALFGDPDQSFDRVLDASGRYVIPGGVDAHTHMEMPFGGTVASDTFETGTRAAAHGGTTTIIDFAIQRQGERVQDTLAAWHSKAAGNCAIDYGFHQILGGVDSDALKAMDELVAEGVTSFKLFMAYPGVYYSDDGQILRAMQQCAGNGALAMMHAENGIAIDQLVAQHIERGETSPYYHGVSRPWELEEEATHRAIMLAKVTGAPLYVVHVSAKQAMEQIATARGRGANVPLRRRLRDVVEVRRLAADQAAKAHDRVPVAGLGHALRGLRDLVGSGDAKRDDVGVGQSGLTGARPRAGFEPVGDKRVVRGNNERELQRGYRPLNCALRFSRNANVPSRMSSVWPTSPNNVASRA